MKRSRWLVFGIMGLVMAVGLSGCITSATPDTLNTVIIKPGETLEFKIVNIPQTTCTWVLDGQKQSETSGTFTYIPIVADLGDHRLSVLTSDTYRSDTYREWNISVEQGPPIAWEQTFGTVYSDDVYSIQQTSDGGYIAAGDFGDPVYGDTGYIAKLDASGKPEWRKMFDPADLESATSVQQTSDGGYIVAGDNNRSNDNYYILACSIIKLDASGTITWKRSFSDGSTGFSKGIIMSIQQTADGGYIAAGYSKGMNIPGVTNHGDFDYYIIRLDAAGNVEWQRMYGGNTCDLARSILQTSDGGYIVAGYSDSKNIEGVTGEGNYCIIRLDSSGDALWQRLYYTSSYYDPDYYDSGPSSIQETSDGGYIIVGSSVENHDLPPLYNRSRGCKVIKLDAEGNVAWKKSYWAATGNAIQQTSDGGYIVAGYKSETINVVIGATWERLNGRLFKLDSSGNKEWDQQYRKNAGVKLFDVRQTADGGYLAAGSCDLGTFTYIWGLWGGEQSSSWGWRNIYHGNSDDWYILKVGPDGEMQ